MPAHAPIQRPPHTAPPAMPVAPSPPAAFAPTPAPAPVASTRARRAYQWILRGDKRSNRGIRYRLLTPDELDALEVRVAKLAATEIGEIDAETYSVEVANIRRREGARAILVAVTRAPVPEPPRPEAPKGADGKPLRDAKGRRIPAPDVEEPKLEDPALWEPLDEAKLHTPGPWHFNELFGDYPGDYVTLKGLFAAHHEINLALVDSILKKEVAV
ncbi:MAG TPA: hypothetical protein VGI39_39750 [Polyangiaceae bacterium]|jgi:hypothetical protein